MFIFIFFLQFGASFLYAAEPIYIKAGRVFTGYEFKENLIIVVQDNYIKDVLFDSTKIPYMAKVVNASNYTILPGFIDTDDHFLSPPNIIMNNVFEKGYNFLFVEYKSNMVNNRINALTNGITTVLDIGDNIEDLVKIEKLQEKNKIMGPAVYYSGPLFTCKNGYIEGLLYQGSHYFHEKAVFEFTDPKEGAAKLLALKKAGISFVTIAYAKYNGNKECARLSLDAVTAVIKQAHLLKLKIFAIVSTDQEALDMVNAGIDGIEHCFKITNHDIFEQVLSLMAQEKIFFTPDLLSVKKFDPDFLPVALNQVNQAYLQRVPIVLGSHFPVPDGDLAELYFGQMALLKEAGLSQVDILRSATTIAAAKINQIDQLGLIKPGAIANLVFLKNDLSNDLTPDHIASVWVNGQEVAVKQQIISDKAQFFKEDVLSFFPNFAYSSDYGFYLGAGLKYYNLFDQYISAGISAGYYFGNGAKTIDFVLGIPSPWQDIAFINSNFHFDDLPKKFFGINNNESKFSYKNYNSTLVSGTLDSAKKLWQDTAVKANVSLERRTVLGVDGNIPGSKGGFLPLLGVSLERDTRDSFYNPWQGDYANFTIDGSNKIAASDFNFGRVKVDLRKYFLVAPYNVLSVRFLYFQAFGDTPFYYLPSFGGFVGRGFAFNRFLGNMMQAWQFEYKFNLDLTSFLKMPSSDLLKNNTFFSLEDHNLQMVLFTELGQVQSEIAKFNVNKYNLSYGAGVRFNVIPQLEYFLAFDIGFSRDDYNLLTYFGQDF
ncbi:MAG: amidohydrolase family protein [Candidatus Margulisiibacteriota bacterium]